MLEGTLPGLGIEERRGAFPRGLVQPEDGYRFSLDPLLLACFVTTKQRDRVLDLGTGCGVAGLALLLNRPGNDLAVLGLDIDTEMTAAAGANARMLGLAERFRAVPGDVRDLRASAGLEPESFDLVLANPPYRALETGREPPGDGRLRARFETAGSLADFTAAMALAAANRGRAALVLPAARLAEAMVLLSERRLTPKRLLLVHGAANASAKLALVETVKNGGEELRIEPPLVLYDARENARSLTPRALAFCPFLACNAGPRPGTFRT